MTLRRTIKAQARLALQGSWGQARLVLLLQMVMLFLINLLDAAVMSFLGYEFQYHGAAAFAYSSSFFLDPFATVFSALVWVIRLIVLAPLGVGMVGWYRQLTDRHRQGVSYIFWPYESTVWLRACGLRILVGLRLLLAAVLLLAVPTFLLTQAPYIASYGSPLHLTLLATGYLLGAVGLVALVIFAKRYCMADMLLGEPYGLTVRQAIRASVRGTRRHCTRLFVVDLSFLPQLLPLLLLGCCYVASNTVFFDPFSMMPTVFGGMVLLAYVFTIFQLQPYYTMTTLMYKRYLQELGTHTEQPAAPAAPVSAPVSAPNWGPVEQPVDSPPETLSDEPYRVVWQDIED